jgi:hypothetical protein
MLISALALIALFTACESGRSRSRQKNSRDWWWNRLRGKELEVLELLNRLTICRRSDRLTEESIVAEVNW